MASLDNYETTQGSQVTQKSLVSVVKDLLNLIPETGSVDLTQACQKMGIPKRKIYFAVNCLEGLSFLEKEERNKMMWSTNVDALKMKHEIRRKKLKKEIMNLERREKKIDDMIDSLKKAKHANLEDLQYAYVMYDDIKKIPKFNDQLMMFVNAPSDTSVLKAPEGRSLKLESKNEPIDVYVCLEELNVIDV